MSLKNRVAKLEREQHDPERNGAIDWTPLVGPPNEWPEPWRGMWKPPEVVDPVEEAIAKWAATNDRLNEENVSNGAQRKASS
jgi:hypothetical protein